MGWHARQDMHKPCPPCALPKIGLSGSAEVEEKQAGVAVAHHLTAEWVWRCSPGLVAHLERQLGRRGDQNEKGTQLRLKRTGQVLKGHSALRGRSAAQLAGAHCFDTTAELT